jgi:hypothetical protein
MTHLNKEGKDMKRDYKPNYLIHPSKILEEMALYELLGEEWAKEIQTVGINPRKAYLLEALFKFPESFFLNLQKNYDKDKKRIEKEQQP